MDFKALIRDVPDFPSNGILFKDITPLLANARALEAVFEALLERSPAGPIHKVVGIESRGFFFAPQLARALKAGFVPVRKPGKLPAAVKSVEYALEYGHGSLEIHADAIAPGERVLVHDDVLATGGTARAACDLIRGMGGTVVQCNFLVELSFLSGRDRLPGVPVSSVMYY